MKFLLSGSVSIWSTLRLPLKGIRGWPHVSQLLAAPLLALLLLVAAIPDTAQAASFQAAGSAQSGRGAVQPQWPSHQVGDVALLFVESASGQAVNLSAAAGFVEVSGSPQYTSGGSSTSGTRVTVFWNRATSTSMPTPTVADAGDHVNAQILTYRGVVATGNPWDVTGGNDKPSASNSISLSSVTTTVANTLIVQVATKDLDSSSPGFSAQSNGNLTGITERTDIGTQSGNGGGFAVWDGGKATAGAIGTTTVSVTNSVNAFLTIALKPLVVVSAANSTVVASPTSVVADNFTTSTITVTLKNGSNNPVSGKTVTLAKSGGNSTITTVSGTTNASGVASFTVKDGTVEGPITYTATDTSDGVTVTQTAQVTFVVVNCTSNASSNWNLPATWINCRGGIPLVNDRVTILAAHTVTLNATTPILGDVTNAGRLNASGSNTLSIGGDLINNGTISLGSSNVDLYADFSNNAGASFNLGGTDTGIWTFRGAVAQNINSSGILTTFPNLVLNNSQGIALNASVTIKTLLTLTNGYISTGSNILMLSASCNAPSWSRGNGFVAGNVRLSFPAASSPGVSCTYPVGSGTSYAPIGLTMVSSGGTLTGTTIGSEHPQIATSGFDSSASANRYWTLSAAGDTLDAAHVTSYGVTLNFVAGDLDPGAQTTSFFVGQYVNNAWTPLLTPSASSGTSVSVSSIAGSAGFGDFATAQKIGNCFQDSFARANGDPGTNWSIGQKYGAYLPAIVTVGAAKRFQLTDTGGAEATWATLQRTFPAAGNKVTVEFDHFAYGGTGADGLGVILSNAAIQPVAGAFGGSMGFAQKSNPGSDCTAPGGCPGFSGGWLGVAIDEFGRFSDATEGRYGGQTLFGYDGSARVVESVAIRGSGFGMSGYRFLAGSNSLTPVVDGTLNQNANPPYRYRITVDHLNSNNAYVSVERDTTGGGNNYVPILGCGSDNIAACGGAIDVLNPANSQDPVPTNWSVTLTGASGGATNIHQVGNLKICTTLGLTTPTLHHLRIYQPGAACTGASAPASVTVKACADSTCSSLYLGSVNANLSSSGSATWSAANPITITGGQATLTLTDNTAQAVTLNATASSPTTANPTLCYNSAGTLVSCSSALTFGACTFDVIEVGAVAFTPIYTKLVGTAFNLDVLSLGGSQVVSNVEIVDASSGSCGGYPTVGSTTIAPLSFTANLRRTVAFTSAKAVRNARIRVTYSGGKSCSSDNFAIRPQQFTLTSTANNATTTGAPAFRAGTDGVTMTATALAGYDGTPKFNLTSGTGMFYIGTPATQTLGSLAAAGFAAAASGTGVATATLTYSEVGNFSMKANAVYDDGFALVDSTKPSPECTPDFSNALNAGKYGCMFGTPALDNLGRFVPDHFSVTAASLTSGCVVGASTYMGQDFAMGLTLTALNGSNQVTTNYDSASVPPKFAAGFDTATWSNYGFGFANGGSSSLASGTAAPTGPWSSGVANVVAYAKYVRPVAPEQAWDSFTVSATPSYADGGKTIAGPSTQMGSTKMRFGRLWLGNAFGSDLADLAVPYQAQYWNGSAFVINTTDSCSCTPPSSCNATLGNKQGGLAAYTGPIAVSATSSGVGTITLTKPATSAAGSVGLVVSLGSPATPSNCASPTLPGGTPTSLAYLGGKWCGSNYDRDPTASATFGVYGSSLRKGPIYIREAY